jgi:hypothetical protein
MASEANCEMMSIFCVPWLCSFFLMGWFALCSLIAIYVATASGDVDIDSECTVFASAA